jgi:hypothetical protein
MRPDPKRALILGLSMGLVLVAMIFLVVEALRRLRLYAGWQADGYTAWIFAIYVFVRWRTHRRIWQLGLVCVACYLMAYLAYCQHHEGLRHIFSRLGDMVALFTVFDGDGKWRRKLWGKLKSAALTAVNAASFKRQTKEAFGAS